MIDRLKLQGVWESTKRIYLSVWRNFNEFFIRLDVKPETWKERITLFVGYLIEDGKQSQTVRNYVSAIKCILKFDGVIVNEDRLLLNAIIRAWKLHKGQIPNTVAHTKGATQCHSSRDQILF